MGRPAEEGDRKTAINITVNGELLARLKDECKVENISGWVNERIREAVLNNSVILKCACGCAASPHVWQRWLGICPTCRADHMKLDRRERIKTTDKTVLEG